ncbi:hypothetical protein Gasu2_29490 [Galdieria sulphuraria]|nr:hypothetical protein Gasu2_29490 [Galdieria sulphuraria]
MSLAKQADKFACYEEAIQNPRKDVIFLTKTFQSEFHQKALRLREDFCGTAAISREFIRSDFERFAVGVDIDSRAVAWCVQHGLSSLHSGSDRLELVVADCREYQDAKFYDIISANNYSLFLLTSRMDLVQYLRRVKQCLDPSHGMFICDLTGGSDCFIKRKVKRQCGNLAYIWEQDNYNFVDASWQCALSFLFRDGSLLKHCFKYTWRLWTMAEVMDALYEVGFSKVRIWFSDLDEAEELVYEETTNIPGWVKSWNAIIVAV